MPERCLSVPRAETGAAEGSAAAPWSHPFHRRFERPFEGKTSEIKFHIASFEPQVHSLGIGQGGFALGSARTCLEDNFWLFIT